MADSPDDDGFVVLDQKATQDYNVAGLLPQPPETLQRIVEWLEPTAYDDGTSEYARHLASHLRGTGDWLADTDEYRRWHGNDHHGHLLWVKAAPGTGKSVIAAHQRATLASSERAIVVYFFFRYIITANRTPMQLIRDWIAQLLPFSPALQTQMREKFVDKQHALQNVTFDELWDEFRQACKTLPRVYCFVDALDEMDLNHDYLSANLLQLEDVPACKVFVTSRPIPRVVEKFRATSAICITLGPENISDDISTYVDHRVERDMGHYIEHRLDLNDSDLGDYETRIAVKPLIKSTLQDKAQGSFLYSKLILDNLLEAIRKMNGDVSLEKVRLILDGLPSGLAKMYDEMLRSYARRMGTSLELQQNILRWVTHSERPLRLLELATVMQSAKGAPGPAADAKAAVRAACGPLLEIMPSDVVGPVHHSFTEFLTSASIPASGGVQNDNFVDFASTHRFIFERCLTYLMHIDQELPEEELTAYDDFPQRFGLEKGVSPTERWTDLKLKYPFFEYALVNWPSHARKCGQIVPSHLQLLDQFFQKTTKISKIWIRSAVWAIDDRGSSYIKHDQPLWSSTVAPLHVAAAEGLPDYAKALVDSGQDVNVTTTFDRTPLHYAASMGHTSILKILLHAGADPRHVDVSQKSSLTYAAVAGHVECVDRLMAAGWAVKGNGNRIAFSSVFDQRPLSDPDRQLTDAVTLAFQHRWVGIIRLFLKYLSAEEAKEIFRQSIGITGLGIAVAFISKPEFDVDEPIRGKTPIQLAVEYADVDCMRALLQRKVRLTSTPTGSGNGGTLLHLLVSCAMNRASSYPPVQRSDAKLIEGMELLIQAGIPIEAVDEHGHTALYYARSDRLLVSALMRLGASPDAAIGGDPSPLHEIAGDDEEGMKFWMRLGCDINARDAAGNTPLHLALRGHGSSTRSIEEKVTSLLALGADPNMHAFSGLAPLHMCHTRLGHSNDLVPLKTLLDAGADPNASDLNGVTPLMTLALLPSEQNELASELLIATGANPAARNIFGETAFLYQIRLCARPDAVESSLSRAPDIHALDSHGNNAALIFCRYPSSIQTLCSLINAGLDFKLSDSSGNTALHKMALVERPHGQRGKTIEDKDFIAMLNRLLELGVETNPKNHYGQTPLHFAMIKGDKVMVEWLLKRPLHEVDVNQADIRGHTPLHIAACVSSSLVLSLINRGADPLRITRTGQSALHLAAAAQNTNVVALLLTCTEAKQRAFVNLADGSGRTALHYAARSGRFETVELLLDAGSDPNIRDHRQCAPLNACAESTVENELRKRACEFVEDHQGSFIPSNDTDHNVKMLGNNVFDCSPVILTKQWEAMARDLSAMRLKSAYEERARPSIRQCAKYLLSSGAEVVFPEPAYGHFQSSRRLGGLLLDPKSAMSDALITGCDSLMYELLEVLEAEEGGAERLNKVIGEPGKLRIAISRMKSKSLEEQVNANYDYRYNSHGISAAFDLFMDEDRGDLATALFITVCKARETIDLSEQKRLLEGFIETGLVDVMTPCVRELGQSYSAHSELESGSWPSSLQRLVSGEIGFRIGRTSRSKLEPGFTPDHVLFEANLFDGTLMKACQSRETRHSVVVLILEEGKVSQQEKCFALAAIATGPRPWHLRTIRVLTKNGADVNVQDPKGRTPLMRACHGAGSDEGLRREVIMLLLELGADVSLLDAKGRSCLDAALGSLQIMQILIQHGAIAEPMDAREAFLGAVRSHSLEVICLLIDSGIDLKQMENQKVPCSIEEREGVQDLNDENGRDISSTVSLLMETYNGRPSIAYMNPRLAETAQFLLDRGADPFHSLPDGSLVLHKLAERGWDIEYILTRPGLDLERRDSKGRTLWLAAASHTGSSTRYQPAETMKTLCELGVDVWATDREGLNFLHHMFNTGTLVGMPDVVRAALEKQVSKNLLNARNKNGYRPIQLALAKQCFKSAEVLLEFGADFTIVDPKGNTAFHHLLASGFFPTGFASREVVDSQSSNLLNKLINYQAMGTDWENQASLAPLVAGETRSIDMDALNAKGEPALFNLLSSMQMSPRVCSALASETNAVQTEATMEDEADAETLTTRLLRKAGLRLDVKSSDGRGALHVLAARRSVGLFPRADDGEVMKEMWTKLVGAGLDPYAEDDEQRSALDVASACGNLCILELY